MGSWWEPNRPASSGEELVARSGANVNPLPLPDSRGSALPPLVRPRHWWNYRESTRFPH